MIVLLSGRWHYSQVRFRNLIKIYMSIWLYSVHLLAPTVIDNLQDLDKINDRILKNITESVLRIRSIYFWSVSGSGGPV